MSLRKITAFALAGALVASLAAGAVAKDFVVDPAIANMSNEQVVEAREAAMKEDGGILQKLGSMSTDEAVAALDKVQQNFTNFPALFREGTSEGSEALPIIWEEKDAFDAIFAAAKAKAAEIQTALAAGDTAQISALTKELGGMCGQCHGKYREKK